MAAAPLWLGPEARQLRLGSDRRAPCLQTFGITEFINAKVLQERGALLTKKIERGRQLLESEKARTAALEASVSDCISCYCCDEAAEEQYCEIRRCLSLSIRDEIEASGKREGPSIAEGAALREVFFRKYMLCRIKTALVLSLGADPCGSWSLGSLGRPPRSCRQRRSLTCACTLESRCSEVSTHVVATSVPENRPLTDFFEVKDTTLMVATGCEPERVGTFVGHVWR
ncbi:hypothetical protein TRIUR3_32827 [Triticum urartu]|uniref:Uncharacterized protein n=1 Tax=Triticum urartu TaxID=4572 RepID=M8AT71_TRIUA|nr:hypothetical protein TRIUR3_32827 [Triticum urartu]